jgi:hypothetical protein
LTELKINKKQRSQIRGNGYTHTKTWVEAKKNRIIFIYVFATFPEIAAIAGGIFEYFRIKDWEGACDLALALWACFSLLWIIAIVYYKHLRYNASVTYEMYKTEQLMYDEKELVFAFTDFGEQELCTYHIPYTQIDELKDYPNVSMIKVVGKFSFEIMNDTRNSVYNKDNENTEKLCIGYYYEEFDNFKRKLEEKTGLQFITEEF